MPFASKAQSRKFYEMYKQGKISYDTLRENIRSTDFAKLPERIRPKGNQQTKRDIAIKGLV